MCWKSRSKIILATTVISISTTWSSMKPFVHCLALLPHRALPPHRVSAVRTSFGFDLYDHIRLTLKILHRKPVAAIVGGAIGGLAFVIAIAVLFLFLSKRNSRRKDAPSFTVDQPFPFQQVNSMSTANPPVGRKMGAPPISVPTPPFTSIPNSSKTWDLATSTASSRQGDVTAPVDTPSAPRQSTLLSNPSTPSTQAGFTDEQIGSMAQLLLRQNLPAPIVTTVVESMMNANAEGSVGGSSRVAQSPPIDAPPSYDFKARELHLYAVWFSVRLSDGGLHRSSWGITIDHPSNSTVPWSSSRLFPVFPRRSTLNAGDNKQLAPLSPLSTAKVSSILYLYTVKPHRVSSFSFIRRVRFLDIVLFRLPTRHIVPRWIAVRNASADFAAVILNIMSKFEDFTTRRAEEGAVPSNALITVDIHTRYLFAVAVKTNKWRIAPRKRI